jgi:hypothetical protein
MHAPSTQVSFAGQVTLRHGSTSGTQVGRHAGPSGCAASTTPLLPAAPTGGALPGEAELPALPVVAAGGVGALASGTAEPPVARRQLMINDSRNGEVNSFDAPAPRRACRGSAFDMDAVVPATAHFRFAR